MRKYPDIQVSVRGNVSGAVNMLIGVSDATQLRDIIPLRVESVSFDLGAGILSDDL